MGTDPMSILVDEMRLIRIALQSIAEAQASPAGKKKQPTRNPGKKKLQSLIVEHCGNVTAIAESLDVDPKTARSWLRPLQNILDTTRALNRSSRVTRLSDADMDQIAFEQHEHNEPDWD